TNRVAGQEQRSASVSPSWLVRRPAAFRETRKIPDIRCSELILPLLRRWQEHASMETSDQPKPPVDVPPDLVGLIRRSGVLSDRQFEELSEKIRGGEYPIEARALADRLIAERILTEFQAHRLLRNKAHGLVVGRYVILDRLGEGSRGRVFKAQHRLMGRMAALKVIAPQIASRASSIARFYREMRLIGRLDHPNVVRAFDADQVGDLLYIVMEYVAGR